MQKKLALLLAVVMTLSLLPMNVFAATFASYELDRAVITVGEDKIMGEKNGDFTATNLLVIAGSMGITSTASFGLELTNAEWSFTDENNTSATGSDVYTTLTAGGAGTKTFTKTGSLGYSITVDPSNASYARVQLDLSGDMASGDSPNYITIPLCLIATEETGNITVHVRDASPNSGISTNTSNALVIAKASAAADYVTGEVKTTVTSKYVFPIDELRIKELVYGSLTGGRHITLIAPDGYRFSWTTAKVTGSLGLIGAPVGDIAALTGTNKSAKYVDITLPDKTTTASTREGTVAITGLTLTTDDPEADLGDVEITVVNGTVTFDGNGDEVAPVTGTKSARFNDDNEFDVKVGVRADWGVTLVAADKDEKIPQLVTGRLEPKDIQFSTAVSDGDAKKAAHKTIEFKIVENVANSLLADRPVTFNVPDGVKLISVDVTNRSKVSNIAKGTVTVNGTPNNAITVKDSYFTVNNVVREKASDKVSLTFRAYVSIDPEFASANGDATDIEITVSGPAITDNIEPLLVATAKRPITVETKLTEVKIGYQFVSTADVTVTETEKGMLQSGKTLELLFDESTGIEFNTQGYNFATSAKVTSGDLVIKPVVKKNAISYIIDRASKTASTITFSNLAVTVDRTTPYSNLYNYKIYVGGEAVAANYMDASWSKDTSNSGGNTKFIADARFQTPGIGADYIRVTTPTQEASMEEVRVVIGASSYTRGGKEYAMPDGVAAFIDPATEATMVPIRFIAYALGVSENNVIWSDKTRTVTIISADRTVKYTVGKAEMEINGVPVEMTTPEGKPVAPQIVVPGTDANDGRTYVPFRQVAVAFGIDVQWDDATKTVIFNPAKE